MAIELTVNDPGTTLASPCASTDASIVVASSTGYPPTGNFRILLGQEIMIVTAVSGTTWTVTRGAEGTGVTFYPSGTPVNHILTSGGLSTLLTQGGGMTFGTYSALPSSSTVTIGAVYICTDGPYRFIHDGTAWQSFNSQWQPVAIPNDALFTWGNQGPATYTLVGGMPLIQAPNVSGDNLRIRYKVISYSPPWSVVMQLTGSSQAASWTEFGMIILETSTSKMRFIGPGDGVEMYSGTGTTTGWSSSTSYNVAVTSPHVWFKTTNTGSGSTALSYYWSWDGLIWNLFLQESQTAVWTTAPNAVAPFAQSEGGNFPSQCGLISYQEYNSIV